MKLDFQTLQAGLKKISSLKYNSFFFFFLEWPLFCSQQKPFASVGYEFTFFSLSYHHIRSIPDAERLDVFISAFYEPETNLHNWIKSHYKVPLFGGCHL